MYENKAVSSIVCCRSFILKKKKKKKKKKKEDGENRGLAAYIPLILAKCFW